MRFTKQLKYAVVLIIMPVLLGGCHIKTDTLGNPWHGRDGDGCKLIPTNETHIYSFKDKIRNYIDVDGCLIIENRVVLERDPRNVQDIADERVAEGADKRNLLGQTAVTYLYKSKNSDSYDATDNGPPDANSSTETDTYAKPKTADGKQIVTITLPQVNNAGAGSGVELPPGCVSNCQIKITY